MFKLSNLGYFVIAGLTIYYIHSLFILPAEKHSHADLKYQSSLLQNSWACEEDIWNKRVPEAQKPKICIKTLPNSLVDCQLYMNVGDAKELIVIYRKKEGMFSFKTEFW